MTTLHLQLAQLLTMRPRARPVRTAAPGPAQPQLAHGELRRVALRAEQSIACGRGCLWVTADGDPRDHVIDAGQRFTASVSASILVYALEDAVFTLEPA